MKQIIAMSVLLMSLCQMAIGQNATKDEINYKRYKGVGIAATVFGGVAIGVGVPLVGIYAYKYSKKSVNDRSASDQVNIIVSGLVIAVGATSLIAGIDAIVKAKNIRTKLDGLPVSINAKMLNCTSYDGVYMKNIGGLGLSLKYSF